VADATFEYAPGRSILDVVDRVESATMQAGWRMATDLGERFRLNIEDNTPVETGALRSSYRITPVDYGMVHTAKGAPSAVLDMAWSGTVYTEISYAEYVERGTGLWGPRGMKYEIKPKHPDGLLHWVTPTGLHVFAKHVWHPGSPGAAMFRIGAVITEHEADEWSHRALRDWERAVGDDARATLVTKARVDFPRAGFS
jgi:hypothetical protein